MHVSAAVSTMQHTAAVPGSTPMQGEVAGDSVVEGGYSDGSERTEDEDTSDSNSGELSSGERYAAQHVCNISNLSFVCV